MPKRSPDPAAMQRREAFAGRSIGLVLTGGNVDREVFARVTGLLDFPAALGERPRDAQRSSRKSLYYLFLHTQSALRFFTSPVYRQALRQQ